MIRRKCYISYKFEDEKYKNNIVSKFDGEYFIDRSQDEIIPSDNPDYIMQQIKEKYLKDSSVTIFLIGTKSYEDYRDPKDQLMGLDSQIIIRREIQSSLYNGNGNKRSGLLGIVLPEMYNKVYGGNYICPYCGNTVEYLYVNNSTVIKEFWQNFYLKSHAGSCCDHYSEDDRYAVVVKYDDFMNDPDKYIEQAYQKREQPISQNVRVRSFDKF